MSDLPVLMIAGLGRCGSSLTMQMLHAGGVPVTGSYPMFEADEMAGGGPVDPVWFRAQQGRAVKCLTPLHKTMPADVPKAVIWLGRDVNEQSLSQMKMLADGIGVGGIERGFSRSDRRVWVASVRSDTARSHRRLGRQIIGLIMFEQLILQPIVAAARLADMVESLGFPPLDRAAMAAVVVPRPTRCAPDMSLEVGLFARHHTTERAS